MNDHVLIRMPDAASAADLSHGAEWGARSNVAPLKAIGLEVTTFLRVGDARSVIVQLATEIKPDALIIGSHSKRNFLDIALGGTAKYVSQHASCTVILVSPEKQT